MDNPTIKAKYVFENTYNPEYVNGAYGGLGPQGELMLNFYLERGAVPREVSYAVGEEGSLEQIETDPSDLRTKYIRYVTSGIIINLKTAKSLRLWLDEMIIEMEARESE